VACVDGGCDGGGAELDAGAEGEGDVGGVGDADEDDRPVGLGDADVDGLPDPDTVGDGEAEVLADPEADGDVNVDGDTLAGWVAPACDVAPAEAGAAVCPPPAGIVDTCAAGDWAGAGGFPAKEVTAKAVAPDIANTTPATQPSTSGRRKRCFGRALSSPVPAATDWGRVIAGGGGPAPGVVAIESAAAPAAGACAVEPSAVVCVGTASGLGACPDSGAGLVAAA
jgi:hypothetical protein